MNGFLELFSQYDVLGAFLVNIELTLWSALFSMILGVILVVMRISPISSLRTVAGAYVALFKNLPLTIIWASCSQPLRSFCRRPSAVLWRRSATL